MLDCPNCFMEMVLTLKCNLTVEECPRCKGIWLDNCVLKEFQKSENSKYMIIEFGESKDFDMKYNDYSYYKKEFIENGSINDMFDFEFD